jgi:hypothetical protein
VTSNYRGPSVLASPHIKSVALACACLTCSLYGPVCLCLSCLALSCLAYTVSACLGGLGWCLADGKPSPSWLIVRVRVGEFDIIHTVLGSEKCLLRFPVRSPSRRAYPRPMRPRVAYIPQTDEQCMRRKICIATAALLCSALPLGRGCACARADFLSTAKYNT